MFGVKVLGQYRWWGDDVILSDRRYFLPYLARALAYTDVTALHRKRLYELVEPFPNSVKALRRASILLALSRGLSFFYRHLKESQTSQNNQNR